MISGLLCNCAFRFALSGWTMQCYWEIMNTLKKWWPVELFLIWNAAFHIIATISIFSINSSNGARLILASVWENFAVAGSCRQWKCSDSPTVHYLAVSKQRRQSLATILCVSYCWLHQATEVPPIIVSPVKKQHLDFALFFKSGQWWKKLVWSPPPRVLLGSQPEYSEGCRVWEC